MNHASLFSGIGGFDLAAQWMDWNNIFQVEWDEWCQKILTKNFPNVKKYKDIKEFDGTKYRGSVDIISGGFPCQPFSTAGKRQGEADDRYLWPEMLRVIREVKPAFVVGENVAGLVSMDNGKTLKGIFSDMENEGYTVESFIIPAYAIGAIHRRDRVWIIGYITNACSNGLNRNKKFKERIKREAFHESYSCIEYIRDNKIAELNRKYDGLSSKLDHDRIKGLGNAIVPQVAFEIFKVIEQLTNK